MEPLRRFSILLLTAAAWGTLVMAQDTQIAVVDVVDIPAALTGQPDHAWYLSFSETWTVSADRPGILKLVISYTVRDRLFPLATEDSLQPAFREFVGELPRSRGMGRIGDISYEFLLMDTEMEQTNNLHGPVSLLVSRYSAMAKHYELQSQLLSVYFHETWFIDPSTLKITRSVDGITPVIWQRRATTEGEPVNDAETGLPVYYKIRLERILLRNP